MLLRSSSTPLVEPHFSPRARHQYTTTLSAVHGSRSSCSLYSSPISPSASGSSKLCPETNNPTPKSFLRARSEGNLQGLASISLDLGEFCNPDRLIRSFPKQRKSMLRTEPSFCIYTTGDGFDGENEREEGEREDLVRSDVGLERIEVGSGEFSFGKKSIGLIEEDGEEGDEVLSEFQDLGIEEVVEPVSPPMYLATGLGLGGGSGGGVFSPACLVEGGDMEEYYKRIVGEDPSNPLFLRNYAQLLQSKGDLHGAEDYFFQATLADPNDGEICSSYAKLVWELHRDQDKASNYFERAARAAPDNSHVQAAYASFLWEIEEDKEEDCASIDHIQSKEDKGENIEDYYKRMVEENPCSSLFLRNYAQFLYQSKGDLRGAEEYYSRAMLADPANGEIISQYAKLVWELHHDQVKALSYFERAIQATPEDSHVLAAYASFLWEIDDEEEEDSSSTQAPLFLGATTPANAQLLHQSTD
ncbi:uncharacterized protein LOC130760353 [Actinidia eriantha]|uniref:uncharacterized protein LOC130760353 n=1 Tax=Actinidia eriantha TaxID=165200 RepID=UPI00258AA741|nr:uncharacterized protein LOC130760353 [Actinidia eriantha]